MFEMKNKVALMFLAMLFMTVSGFAVESMGLYQVKPGDRNSTFLDTAAWSYTRNGYLNVHLNFGEKDISRTDKKMGFAAQFTFELTREEYQRIFESQQALTNMPSNDHIWNRNISTSNQGNRRIVNVSFIDPTDGHKRGKLEIVLEKEVIVSLRMMKEKKRMIGGYKMFFEGHAKNMKRSEKGLALRDSGQMGRVTEVTAVDMALADKSAKGFNDALNSQKKRR